MAKISVILRVAERVDYGAVLLWFCVQPKLSNSYAAPSPFCQDTLCNNKWAGHIRRR